MGSLACVCEFACVWAIGYNLRALAKSDRTVGHFECVRSHRLKCALAHSYFTLATRGVNLIRTLALVMRFCARVMETHHKLFFFLHSFRPHREAIFCKVDCAPPSALRLLNKFSCVSTCFLLFHLQMSKQHTTCVSRFICTRASSQSVQLRTSGWLLHNMIYLVKPVAQCVRAWSQKSNQVESVFCVRYCSCALVSTVQNNSAQTHKNCVYQPSAKKLKRIYDNEARASAISVSCAFSRARTRARE